MLTFLSVTDFATIEHLDLELSSGFTVLTGETGAGKSIIVDALSFLLGGRADTNVVRSGASQTKIEGIFRLNDQARMAILPLLREHGLDRDADEDLIIGREINREGPNVCRINGGLVSLRFLSAIGERIVDLHGQGEHLSLLRVPEHVRLLDNYAGSAALRQEVSDGVSRLAAVRQELTSLRGTERDSSSRADLLRFQIAEIRTAQLRAGEDEELRRELALLSNRERVQSLVEETLGVLRDGSRGLPSAIDLVGTAIGNLSYLEEYDPSWGPRREELANAVESLAELVRTLDGYRDDGEDSDRRLGEVGDRLDLIAGLKRKYGSSMDHVVAFAERAESELDAIVHD
ncbi:MAG: AAA family ATPase, partial [Chloroflexi bacterium]|nr:AAA family ATPase [Chloroflexota bacterium]